ncbi:MAG: hypothetical protein LIO65_05955, partial [Odoribacter sp.]|nr:hypothetical protein [Odoribacter sp.]
ITSLLTHMYQNILLKSSRKGIIVNTDKCWEYFYNLFCLETLFNGFKFYTREGEVCPEFLCKP